MSSVTSSSYLHPFNKALSSPPCLQVHLCRADTAQLGPARGQRRSRGAGAARCGLRGGFGSGRGAAGEHRAISGIEQVDLHLVDPGEGWLGAVLLKKLRGNGRRVCATWSLCTSKEN